ncbi:hypothetical protein [Intrasporangium calvum]|uniref:Uncharacterized protein n=1 Tax=Intrasporangium calvum (strain ATCC 23552 / DSM 43043 / JCM 3097 / NBRC 12989 / NCIMB 10167 / NRRL B-3866 / 7 KIP) TaxID=710696 RepID=E6S6M2_INTC7|nr:hypothetical protein [Intrasporangium calvum]ADU50039.1 hypothetical protein Intca_3566 [Intrasporangium calvum DSM 43043]
MTQEPGTRRERRELERRARGPAAAVAIVVVALLVLGGAVWFGKDLFVGSPTAAPLAPATTAAQTTTSPPATSQPTTEATVSETPTPTVDPVAAAVDECRSAWARQVKAAAAASTALREWDAHLDIMNDLQAGKISLAKAKKDWAPTTAKAPQHIAAFHSADRTYRSAEQRCALPENAPTGDEAKALSTCAASMKVVDGILAKARAAVEPWETHLKDQSHFKAGGITAIRAEALWRSLWQKGLKRNPPYFRAVAAGAKATCPIAG